MYTAVVLSPVETNKLRLHFAGIIPPSWSVICHHMTIAMGSLENSPARDYRLGTEVELTVVNYAYDNKVMAAGVTCDVPSSNQNKHITLAVDRTAGGKPVMSNQLTNWQPISPLVLVGRVEECL